MMSSSGLDTLNIGLLALCWPIERFQAVDALTEETLPEPGVDGLIITGSTPGS